MLSSGYLFAQNEEDALRYSFTYFGGTARNMATAGGLTAMGGDFGNVSHNPAGLARFSKSNFSFTPHFEIPSAKTNFNGTDHKSSRFTANIGNISYVKAYQLDPRKFSNWYSLQIGLGFNRIRSFNDSISYNGYSDSSIVHSFIADAWGTPTEAIYSEFPFTAGLAYDVYAIDPGLNQGEYVPLFQNGQARHERQLRRKGGITEFNILTLSGNYANKLLVGASFNYVRAVYSESLVHKETYSDSSNWLNWINYTGNLDIKGNGLNVRVGAIYMPIPQVRVGLAIETPTSYWMKDYWTNNMQSGTDSGDKFIDSEFVPTGSYQYKIRTPFKANVSAAYVMKKFGSVGFEIEYVDYSGSRLKSRKYSSAPYSFASENAQIDNIYKTAFNIKFGLEGRIKERTYVRGGFAYYGTPYTKASGNDLSPTLFITGGGGYNFGILYLDAAYVLQSTKQDYYAYDPTIPGSYASFDLKNSRIVLTAGLRF